MSSNVIHIVAGPTASGKSGRALAMAADHDGVIVNCDSLQIYNGLPVLTAQPGTQEKNAVPHALYAVRHPDDTCSAGTWREMAEPVIEKILADGKTPIITGGTGLYIKALLEGLSPIPDIPVEVRERGKLLHKEMGPAAFYEMLQACDPEMASRLTSGNTVRLIRAWEVIEHTRRSLAAWQQAEKLAPPAHWHFEIHKMMPAREELVQRCDERFLWMMENGAPEEVEAFDQKIEAGEIRPDVPLTKALGFQALRAYIRGTMSREAAIAQGQQETRQYAKRQMTWFRHQL